MRSVLKLGGSVVTRKDERETVDADALDRIATVLGDHEGSEGDDLVLVHGGGGFGHPAAADHDVSASDGTRDAEAVASIHGAMTRLSEAVCAALRDRGRPAVPVRPLSFAMRDARGRPRLRGSAVRVLLAEGFLPVAHGDIVAHRGAGASILSGDAIAVGLARELHADRIGLCAATPVRDEDDTVVDRITEYGDVAEALGASRETDVTGGMAAKVRALLDADRPAAVFALDDLDGFLAGEWPGTRIDGG